jgi:hypothetical protein
MIISTYFQAGVKTFVPERVNIFEFEGGTKAKGDKHGKIKNLFCVCIEKYLEERGEYLISDMVG